MRLPQAVAAGAPFVVAMRAAPRSCRDAAAAKPQPLAAASTHRDTTRTLETMSPRRWSQRAGPCLPHAARGAADSRRTTFLGRPEEGQEGAAGRALADSDEVSKREYLAIRAVNKQFVAGDLPGALEDYRFISDLYPGHDAAVQQLGADPRGSRASARGRGDVRPGQREGPQLRRSPPTPTSLRPGGRGTRRGRRGWPAPSSPFDPTSPTPPRPSPGAS